MVRGFGFEVSKGEGWRFGEKKVRGKPRGFENQQKEGLKVEQQ
jgi:hypothetical protein